VKKSTVLAMVIIAVGFAAILFTFKVWTDQFVEEVKNGKALTREFTASLLKGQTVKLLRVVGDERYLVKDKASPGLLLEAHPSEEVWVKDNKAFGLSRDLATRCFELYGPERPIRWVEFHLFRPDNSRFPSFTLLPAETGRGFTVIEAPK
jgi:hypothetical protein